MSIAEIIFTFILIWFLGGAAFTVIAIAIDIDIIDGREGTAKVVLWPITIIFYIFLGLVWIVKHFYDTILLGFWDFIKSIPNTIKEL